MKNYGRRTRERSKKHVCRRADRTCSRKKGAVEAEKILNLEKDFKENNLRNAFVWGRNTNPIP